MRGGCECRREKKLARNGKQFGEGGAFAKSQRGTGHSRSQKSWTGEAKDQRGGGQACVQVTGDGRGTRREARATGLANFDLDGLVTARQHDSETEADTLMAPTGNTFLCPEHATLACLHSLAPSGW